MLTLKGLQFFAYKVVQNLVILSATDFSKIYWIEVEWPRENLKSASYIIRLFNDVVLNTIVIGL
jgi:hypothetical protein